MARQAPSSVPAAAARWIAVFLVALSVSLAGCRPPGEPPKRHAVVGSKNFTEGVILGELVTQLVEQAGVPATHRSGLGGTQVLWNALRTGSIDAYADYTGTIHEEIFPRRRFADNDALRDALRGEFGIRMSEPLGFENAYLLGTLKTAPPGISQAEWDAIETISDLRKFPDLRMRFSNEFMERADGWPALKAAYRLPQQDVRGIDHDLAYRGLTGGSFEVIDLYSTDAKIAQYDLKVLRDDLGFFPEYHAVILYRDDLHDWAPESVAAMRMLEGTLAHNDIFGMNVRVDVAKDSERVVAADYLRDNLGVEATIEPISWPERIGRRTLEHLLLVGVSVSAAILVAVPLGIVAAKRPKLGQGLLGVTGIMQTVPSLALFVFLIPLLGLGTAPTVCALFVYSLLPIVRNTHAGLSDIPPAIHESARALGLPPWARLWRVELPMASRSILAGIKTAAVINVGTATLGGFIGAGGYGQPIFAGIRKDDTALLLAGAVPAALMALAVQLLFELADRRLVPEGLRLKAGS